MLSSKSILMAKTIRKKDLEIQILAGNPVKTCLSDCSQINSTLIHLSGSTLYVLNTLLNATAKKLIDHDFRERKSCRENNPLGHIGMPEAILIEASSISLPTKGAARGQRCCFSRNQICLQLSKQHQPA